MHMDSIPFHRHFQSFGGGLIKQRRQNPSEKLNDINLISLFLQSFRRLYPDGAGSDNDRAFPVVGFQLFGFMQLLAAKNARITNACDRRNKKITAMGQHELVVTDFHASIGCDGFGLRCNGNNLVIEFQIDVVLLVIFHFFSENSFFFNIAAQENTEASTGSYSGTASAERIQIRIPCPFPRIEKAT